MFSITSLTSDTYCYLSEIVGINVQLSAAKITDII